MSATSFAGEKVEGKDWKVDVNVAKLSKYLNLDARQMEAYLFFIFCFHGKFNPFCDCIHLKKPLFPYLVITAHILSSKDTIPQVQKKENKKFIKN